MSNGLVAIFFAIGVGGWSYAQLAKRNGNANPSSNAMGAAIAGVVAGIFIFTLFKFVLHF